MKTKSIIIAILFAIVLSVTSNAQMIDINRAALMKSTNTSIGLLHGESPTKCIQVLGQPASITDQFSEVDDATMKVYKYGNNRIWFLDNKMIAYEILDNTIRVGAVNGQTFKIGDPMTVTIIKVPIDPRQPGRTRDETRYSFLDFRMSIGSGTTDGKAFRALSVAQLKNGATNTDGRLELLFNASNQLFCISMLE
ncbi:hypothetical protein [Dyadobacter sp. OTU695]|uniref:hypothetical protein n=1 Tax=Dyadobacter sp. OTU695 TaxID=3043860 RepID=UPI00313B3106